MGGRFRSYATRTEITDVLDRIRDLAHMDEIARVQREITLLKMGAKDLCPTDTFNKSLETMEYNTAKKIKETLEEALENARQVRADANYKFI